MKEARKSQSTPFVIDWPHAYLPTRSKDKSITATEAVRGHLSPSDSKSSAQIEMRGTESGQGGRRVGIDLLRTFTR